MSRLPEQPKPQPDNVASDDVAIEKRDCLVAAGLVFHLVVHPNEHGRRIDAFLARHFRNYTSFRLHRMVAAGQVKVDDHLCDVTQRVFRFETVSIHLIEPPDKLLDPEQLPLRVLYDDPWMMVVDKPAGMVAHPIGEFQTGTLCNGIQNQLDFSTVAIGLLRPGIVHRLDRMTSGLLMIAKTADMHARLSTLVQDGRVDKQYLALVEGHPTLTDQIIDLPIGSVPGSSILMSVASNSRNPRTARTDIKVLNRLRTSSLVQCRLHTGRNHQIRVHLAAIGHPVVGDEFYCVENRVNILPESERDLFTRHALHATILKFVHPILKHTLTVRSTPPADFWRMLGRTDQSHAIL